MQQTIQRANTTGLCATCVHVDGCMYRASGHRDAFHCEEFSDRFDDRRAGLWGGAMASPAPGLQAEAGPLASSSSRAATSPVALASAAAGLCGDCVHAPTCALSARPLGVWACEDYA